MAQKLSLIGIVLIANCAFTSFSEAQRLPNGRTTITKPMDNEVLSPSKKQDILTKNGVKFSNNTKFQEAVFISIKNPGPSIDMGFEILRPTNISPKGDYALMNSAQDKNGQESQLSVWINSKQDTDYLVSCLVTPFLKYKIETTGAPTIIYKPENSRLNTIIKGKDKSTKSVNISGVEGMGWWGFWGCEITPFTQN